MGSILCEHCAAACCRYLALPIDKPTSARDYDDIRWYLLHKGVSVFVEDGDWYVQFQARCRALGSDNLCAAYETRPHICRQYMPDSCDYSGGSYSYDHLFTHPQQIEKYYHDKTGKKLGLTQASAAAPPERLRKSGKAKSKTM